MPNLVEVSYAQNGQSISTNAMGMREMQARAFAARNAQYLLLKAPAHGWLSGGHSRKLSRSLVGQPGTAAIKPRPTPAMTADAKLRESFEEINAFIREHGCEPEKNHTIQERQLYSKLQGIRHNPEKWNGCFIPFLPKPA